MDLRPHFVLHACSKDSLGILHCKKTPFAEYIDIICQFFCSNLGYHFVDHQVDKIRLSAFIFRGYSMCPEESGDQFKGGHEPQPSDDPQHFKFILNSEPVTAFNLNRSGSHHHNLLQSRQGLHNELLLRSLMQPAGRIQYPSSPACDLLVRKPPDLVDILYLPAAGKHQVGMRIAEGRENHAVRGINHLHFHSPGFTEVGNIFHLPEIADPVAFNVNPGILNCFKFCHFGSGNFQFRFTFNLYKLPDVFDQQSHKLVFMFSISDKDIDFPVPLTLHSFKSSGHEKKHPSPDIAPVAGLPRLCRNSKG